MPDDKQQFNVYLTPDLVRQIKHHSVDVQLSLSDLVEKVLRAYLDKRDEQPAVPQLAQPPIADLARGEQQASGLTLQPMIHVEQMAAAIKFYEALGFSLTVGSRDGDWAQMRLGGAELGLLAHPPNPEQNEGIVELNFESQEPLEALEARLREAGVTIARPTGDEGFGAQLQVQSPDGLLVKINQLDPGLYGWEGQP